jgi:hypothetical protein
MVCLVKHSFSGQVSVIGTDAGTDCIAAASLGLCGQGIDPCVDSWTDLACIGETVAGVWGEEGSATDRDANCATRSDRAVTLYFRITSP